ncbi:type I-E CRISPR-associated protein Cas7/Cse4/CasC [Methylomonas albis]|uniref:Type I-E CRISPR-associated protein Cas7/Cse4/CasC n=1 Tax=Methylomonas albis TaxID=1854563 RepID=A0ABR9D3Z1_9GAMM|nr:type I-E CRISPR-associated protein Cas7/Cse4/CasC [Methylomonas albis]MBD9357837.1 type I-E CRISPR-associated protein Cas7/Cse4/CasC [Methylomonas albis]
MNQANPLKGVHIEYHILQSFPVSCLNRDDVGAPKSAVVGGVTRARVSSQAWKRAVRLALRDFGVKLAIRSKLVADYVAEACIRLGAAEEQAQACAMAIGSALTKDTLLFFSSTEAQAFAEFAKQHGFDSGNIKDKEIHKLAKKALNPAVDGLDIALFGRMVAQAAELNVEAAAAFSHAISTHKVSNEVEFFTALDDLQDDPGAAHMGSLEFNSATYYRYISLDLGQLCQTLVGQNLPEAVEAFTKALFVALPAARQTTQSAASPWEFAKVLVRKGQRLQVPFETAVKPKDGGFLQPSKDALVAYLTSKEKLSGSLFGKIAEYTWGEDENFSVDDLIAALKRHAEGCRDE